MNHATQEHGADALAVMGYIPPDPIQELELGAWHKLRRADAALRAGRALPPASAFQRRVPPDAEDPGYRLTTGGVAVIRFHGYVTNRLSFWGWLFGGCASCEYTQAALSNALADSNVRAILLDIDSPGGSVDGVADLAGAIYAARSKKPIKSLFSNCGASAAYHIGCQASQSYVNSNGLVGSIGVVWDYEDWSRLEKNVGVEHEVIVSAPLKSAGYDGPLTPAQREEWQGRIDKLADLFSADVARGRGIATARAKALSDARVYVGAEAVAAGLVDGVSTLADLIGQIEAELPQVPDAASIVLEPPYYHTDEARAAVPASNSEQPPPPTAARKEPEMSLSKENLAALGLPETATADETNKRLAERLAQAQKAQAGAPANEDVQRRLDELTAMVTAQNERLALQTEAANRLAAAAAEQEARSFVDELKGITGKPGKITGKQKEAALSLARKAPEEFRAFMADAPRVVPNVSVFNPDAKDADALDGTERELRAGAFSDIDPRDAEAGARLDAAAEKYAAQKGISITAAINELVGAN